MAPQPLPRPPSAFKNPYPDGDWDEIADFRYETPLILYRHPSAVQMREDRDADYLVGEDYRVSYKLDGTSRDIVVPKGMATDLSSVPSALRSLVGQVGPHLEASIVHDFLYIAWQDIDGRAATSADRRFSDELFRVGMIAGSVTEELAGAIHAAVRIAGKPIYRRKKSPRYFKI